MRKIDNIEDFPDIHSVLNGIDLKCLSLFAMHIKNAMIPKVFKLIKDESNFLHFIQFEKHLKISVHSGENVTSYRVKYSDKDALIRTLIDNICENV